MEDGTNEHSLGAALSFALNGIKEPSSWSNAAQDVCIKDVPTTCCVVECQRYLPLVLTRSAVWWILSREPTTELHPERSWTMKDGNAMRSGMCSAVHQAAAVQRTTMVRLRGQPTGLCTNLTF